MKLIDKSAIVAEIKSRIKESDKLADVAADNNLHNVLEANELLIRQYTSLLNFLYTLEVKEADLEEEIKSWLDHGHITDTRYGNYDDNDIESTAKHFFELGLK